ncbi:MAG: hypothetical protein V4697_04140 [Patescibacteria group bacterium]
MKGTKMFPIESPWIGGLIGSVMALPICHYIIEPIIRRVEKWLIRTGGRNE